MKQIKSPVRLSSLMAETKNFNFVQLSELLTPNAKISSQSPIAHEILYYLVRHMGRTTNAVVCSYTTLCEIAECE